MLDDTLRDLGKTASALAAGDWREIWKGRFGEIHVEGPGLSVVVRRQGVSIPPEGQWIAQARRVFPQLVAVASAAHAYCVAVEAGRGEAPVEDLLEAVYALRRVA